MEIQGGTFTSGGGSVTLTGIGGSGGTSLKLDAGSVTTALNGGDITLVSDRMALSGGTVSTLTSDQVTIRPYTTGQLINLGTSSDTIANTLGLSDAELDRITTGTLIVGDASSGAITISAALSPANYKTLALARDTTFAAAGQFNSDLGPTASDYEKLTVHGTVTIASGAQLNLAATGGFTPSQGQSFTLLANDSSDPVGGTFTGKNEGFTFANFLASGQDASLTYDGGDGNDIVVALGLTSPVAGADTIHRAPNRTIKIPVATLLANDSTLSDRTLSITGVASVSTEGLPLTLVNGVVLYTPTMGANFDDSFTYTLSDGILTSVGTVQIIVDDPAETQTQNVLSAALTGGGEMQITVAGIPGRNYQLQVTGDLTAPVTWTDLGAAQVAPEHGQMLFTDPAPASPSYYRVVETPGS